MREITRHKTDKLNREHIAIFAEQPEEKDKAPAKYHVRLKGLDGQYADFAKIVFQSKPLQEVVPGGVLDHPASGLTIEVLIAVCIDRLQAFQSAPLQCRQNAIAITKLEEALLWLGDRSRERTERGVEGTYKVVGV